MPKTEQNLAGRYRRLADQLAELCHGENDPIARMATIVALLHHKLPHFFWTGFYRYQDGKLVVGPYQGPLACAVLPGPGGVCWAALRAEKTLIVADVHEFPGHVTCDSRSQSEIVVPVPDPTGKICAVLDVDSESKDAFGEIDRRGLETIVALIHQ